jgi:CDP-diacylglycerol--glycerol-3-phosphate 3-phosphatidyltransferase
MNIANKLTIARFVIIPLMLVVINIDFEINIVNLELGEFIFLLMFVIAGFTDYLDGYLARKYNMVTNLGKFLDPIADKMLVATGLAYLVSIQAVPVWIFIVIISREFLMSGFRIILSEKKIVLAANKLGKYKTAFTMFTITFYLIRANEVYLLLGDILLLITVVLTLTSGLKYFLDYKKHIIF